MFDAKRFSQCQRDHRMAEASGDMVQELAALTALWKAAEEGAKYKYGFFLHELRRHLGLSTESHEHPIPATDTSPKSHRNGRIALDILQPNALESGLQNAPSHEMNITHELCEPAPSAALDSLMAGCARGGPLQSRQLRHQHAAGITQPLESSFNQVGDAAETKVAHIRDEMPTNVPKETHSSPSTSVGEAKDAPTGCMPKQVQSLAHPQCAPSNPLVGKPPAGESERSREVKSSIEKTLECPVCQLLSDTHPHAR